MIVIMGLPGAGKTTVLKEASRSLPRFKIVNYGDVMLDIAMKEKMVSNRDELRRLPAIKQREIQKKAAQKIASEKGEVLLDTHCSIKTRHGYLPGLPGYILEDLKPQGFVLIVAPPQDVVGRRMKDISRRRDSISEDEIRDDMAVNKSYMISYSALTGAPVVMIENADGKLSEAVEKLKEFLKEID